MNVSLYDDDVVIVVVLLYLLRSLLFGAIFMGWRIVVAPKFFVTKASRGELDRTRVFAHTGFSIRPTR